MSSYTRAGKDLEAEVISRCVKAIRLEGQSSMKAKRMWRRRLDQSEIRRVLRYLSDRFGVQING